MLNVKCGLNIDFESSLWNQSVAEEDFINCHAWYFDITSVDRTKVSKYIQFQQLSSKIHSLVYLHLSTDSKLQMLLGKLVCLTEKLKTSFDEPLTRWWGSSNLMRVGIMFTLNTHEFLVCWLCQKVAWNLKISMTPVDLIVEISTLLRLNVLNISICSYNTK